MVTLIYKKFTRVIGGAMRRVSMDTGIVRGDRQKTPPNNIPPITKRVAGPPDGPRNDQYMYVRDDTKKQGVEETTTGQSIINPPVRVEGCSSHNRQQGATPKLATMEGSLHLGIAPPTQPEVIRSRPTSNAFLAVAFVLAVSWRRS